MSQTNAYADQLIETLTAAADHLHEEVGLPLSVIADAMDLGCGIPHSVFGLDGPSGDYRPEPPDSDSSAIHTLGLIGAGTMSQGIARAALQESIDVRLVARDPERAAVARDAVIAEIGESSARVDSSSDIEALAEADVIIEAISEDLASKQRILAGIERIVPEDAILATTTSSLAISDIASALAEPRRLVGLHFFNPADRNRLVEFVSVAAPQEHLARTRQLAAQLGKCLIDVPDAPGFIVNRVLIPYLNTVFDLLDLGAPLREIDLDLRRRYRVPVGPARLAGIIGADVVLAIQTSLHQRLGRPELRPAPALQAMVDRGVLGSKTGHMFPTAMTDGD